MTLQGATSVDSNTSHNPPSVTPGFGELEMRVPFDDATSVLGSFKSSTACVYFALWTYASFREHFCFPSIAALAERANVSERTAQGAIAELADAGVITVEDRYLADGKSRTSNGYVINRVPEKYRTPRCKSYTPPGVQNLRGAPAENQGVTSTNELAPKERVSDETISAEKSASIVSPDAPDLPPDDPAPPKAKRSEAQLANDRIIDAYYEAMGLDIKQTPPTKRFYGLVKNVRMGGITPEEVKGIIGMLQRDPWWSDKTITLETVLKNADKYRIKAAQHAKNPQLATEQYDAADYRRYLVPVDPNKPPKKPVYIFENERQRQIADAKMKAWTIVITDWKKQFGDLRQWALNNMEWPPEYGEEM